ncbi:LacI family DNA-binding transcriptional regulator [Streptomyces sp. ISL-22]|uniref:LacI family DNA-binding transcriptional regulator n=1 Tax=unclassified Streptomyces TaxID=2593676 RepID=UPI001BE5C24A|nr:MULTISPECIES: LacI family DNA-binding transcriptional regulator [unclassified Streptomyces]MBT2418549.1 LacI family DNA-binding transcriptional regulator [Streptomyces sp. ISL-24]MBT2434348.1 LacI family DNA-binding transcriptional regulator [Streptomyces sp. ISL-22]
MADVAERAGVSTSTVSRTLRGLSTVSPEVRARVEQAARELNFAVSRQAASLVTGRTGNVAVLVPTLQSWFMGTALSSLAPLLRAAGMELNVYVIPDLAERTSFFERLPARRNADALLVFCFDLTDEETASLDNLGMPVVYVSQHVEGRPSIYVDDVAGALHGTRHLLNLGHRRIAFVQTIGASGFSFSSNERLIGYQQALTEAGLPLDDDLVVATEPGDKRGAAEAIGRLLSLREPPTAVFAEQDEVAVAAIWTLRKTQIPVPERVSVLGFDDQPIADWFDLSTVAQSPADIGREAGELALCLINAPDADHKRHIVLPTHVIPRATTAPPPQEDREG